VERNTPFGQLGEGMFDVITSCIYLSFEEDLNPETINIMTHGINEIPQVLISFLHGNLKNAIKMCLS